MDMTRRKCDESGIGWGYKITTTKKEKKAFGINFAHSILVLLPGRKRRYVTAKVCFGC